jgi:hypothetical protein
MNTIIEFEDISREEVIRRGIEWAGDRFTGTKEHAIKLAVAYARHHAITINGKKYDDCHKGLNRPDHREVQKVFNSYLRAHWKLY